MPAFSVCLLLDERADRAVRGLWHRLEGDGLRTLDLLHHQASVAAALNGHEVHRHYRPGSWQPHLTLAPRMPAESLPQVASRVYEVLPLPARLHRLVVVDTSTGTVHDLSSSAAPAGGTSRPGPPSP